MVAVPGEIPVTMPVVKPTVAIVVLLLVHVPPPGASDNAVVNPVHTVLMPAMGDGVGLTVTVIEEEQPVDNL